MAERRMFAKSVVESDAFCELPPMSQLMYFHLLMHADDDGFVDCQRRVRLIIGASVDDVQTLVDKGYLIPFEGGLLCITHWRLQNNIPNDRYKATIYKDCKASLDTVNKVYVPVNNVSTGCIHNVSSLETQESIGEIRVGQVSVDKVRVEPLANSLALPPTIVPKLIDWFEHKAQKGGEQTESSIKSLLKLVKKNIEQHGEIAVSDLIDTMIMEDRGSIYFDRLERRDTGERDSREHQAGTPKERHGIYL